MEFSPTQSNPIISCAPKKTQNVYVPNELHARTFMGGHIYQLRLLDAQSFFGKRGFWNLTLTKIFQAVHQQNKLIK